MISFINLSDVQGFIRLIISNAELITNGVEEIHSNLVKPLGLVWKPPLDHTHNIIRLMYQSIRGYYHLVGSGVDAILGTVIPMFDSPPSTSNREALLAILNGIWGDYLVDTNNPLAITMSLRYRGLPLTLEKSSLREAIPQASRKLLVLVHGLCMNDLQWSRNDHNHGEALSRDLGFTAVYLHYNSGLHISANGRQFANLLEALINEWPQPVEEVAIIGHSMGGLVARSAYHYATLTGQTWQHRLRKLVFLGTPHHGSPLERIGNWADENLKAIPYSAPIRYLSMRRSVGITDLRYGSLVDEDWEDIAQFTPGPDNRRTVPLPVDVQCYAIGATLGATGGDLADQLFGDGLVPLDSALGLHHDPARALSFPEFHQWISYNTGHLDLLDRPEVYQKLKSLFEN